MLWVQNEFFIRIKATFPSEAASSCFLNRQLAKLHTVTDIGTVRLKADNPTLRWMVLFPGWETLSRRKARKEELAEAAGRDVAICGSQAFRRNHGLGFHHLLIAVLCCSGGRWTASTAFFGRVIYTRIAVTPDVFKKARLVESSHRDISGGNPRTPR